MIISKFLNPKNDVAFKRIFGQEKNKDIVIDFINDMLGFAEEGAIQTVEFLPTAQDPEIAAKKQSIVDIRCTDGQGRHYIVEMQVNSTPGFEKRAQYYAAKAYSQQLDRSEQYEELKEIIFLAITDFVMFPDKKEYKSDHMILDRSNYDHDLKDFYFSFLELPKFTKTLDELETVVEKWTYFFKHAEETQEKDIVKILGLAPAIKRAYEELDRFHWTEAELNFYEEIEKRDRDAEAIVHQRQLKHEAEQALLAAKSAEIAAKAAQVEAKAAEVETKAAEVETKAAEVETKAAEVETKAAEVETKAAEVETKAAEVEAKEAQLAANKAEVEAKAAQVEAKKIAYLEEGMQQGMQQGMQERDIAIAKNLLSLGQPDAIVAQVTGLSLTEVAQLKK